MCQTKLRHDQCLWLYLNQVYTTSYGALMTNESSFVKYDRMVVWSFAVILLSFKAHKGYKHQQVLTLNLAHLHKGVVELPLSQPPKTWHHPIALCYRYPILNLYLTVAAYRAKGAAVCGCVFSILLLDGATLAMQHCQCVKFFDVYEAHTIVHLNSLCCNIRCETKLRHDQDQCTYPKHVYTTSYAWLMQLL